MKFHSNPVILLNRSKFHSKKVNTHIFEYIGEIAVEIFDSKIQKVWFMYMTSLINPWRKVSKIWKIRTTSKWSSKLRFQWFFLHNYIKTQGFVAMTFTENYRKVRNLPEGQIWKIRTISTVMIEILLLMSLITPRELSERFVSFVLFISWLVTWYGQKHFYIS